MIPSLESVIYQYCPFQLSESAKRVLKEHAYYTACFKEVNSDEDKSCYIKEKKIKEFFKNTYKYA